MTYDRQRPPTTAGAVVPFKPKPGVPVLLVGGRKYALSTDGGALGDRVDDDPMKDSPLGARLIRPPTGANKWRYLWAHDTDRQTLTMWRVSDGNEKTSASATSQQARIVALDKKGQLNRVTNEEFRRIEKEMRRREDDTMGALKASIESMKSDAVKELDAFVREFFEEKVYPILMRRLDEVRRGITPIGFRPDPLNADDGEGWRLRRQSSHVLGDTFRRLMSEEQVEAWLTQKGFPLNLIHNQDIQWTIDDVRDDAVKYLPERPDTN